MNERLTVKSRKIKKIPEKRSDSIYVSWPLERHSWKKREFKGRIVRDRPRLIFIPLTGTGRFFRFRGRYPFSFLLHISLDGGRSLQALPLGHWPEYSRGIINASRVSDCTFEGISRNSKESGGGGKKRKEGEEEVSGSISNSAT